MCGLNDIFKSHPGYDEIELVLHGADQRRVRIEIPLKVSAKDYVLRAECANLLGSQAYVKCH